MFKKIFIAIIVLLIIIAGGVYFYPKGGSQQNKLDELKENYSDLAQYVDDVRKWEDKLTENEDAIDYYSALGLAWKSLADWSGNHQEIDNMEYYKKALEVYDKAIIKTNRRNTLFMMNAGNMAKYLEDYTLAEDYYKEAISVAPGDVSLYVLLAELYEYQMDKTEEEVVAVYDEGIEIAVDSGFLIKRKESYLKRVDE